MQQTIGNNELIVFVDVKPDEQIDTAKDEYLCFTAVVTSFTDKLNVKPYKSTRSKNRKIRTVQNLIRHVKNKELDIKAITIAGKMNGHLTHWSSEVLNQAVVKIGSEWEVIDDSPKNLIWNGKKYDLKRVLGIGAYANMLALIGLRFATFLKDHPQYDKVIFALDNLPINTADSMELMRALTFASDSAEMWKSNLEHGVTFQIINVVTYSNSIVMNVPAKEHPGFILADWMAATSLAKVYPQQLKSQSGFTDDEIKQFEFLWETINASRPFQILNLDDPNMVKKVKNIHARENLKKK